MKNLKKCSFSQQKFDSFLERVKQLQKKREMNLKNLKNKFLESETSEMNAHIKMNKNSKKLLKTYYRSPLYQHKPLNEEKSIGKNFENFYADILKENQINTYFSKNNKCKNKDKNITYEDKFNKFYEDKIKWKKNVEQKNKNRKLNLSQENEEFLDTFSYKPNIDKHSINIVKKLNKNRSFENLCKNNFYESGNDREALDKFKAKLKPIINDYYNNYINHIPYINRKNREFQRTMSEINLNFNKKIDLSNKINKNKKNKNKIKPKLNYKLNEKKFLDNTNNKNKKRKLIKDFNYNFNEKDNYLMKQIEGIDNKKKEKNEGEDLYKLNVRPGGAWNKEYINKIASKKQCYRIIEDLL